MTPSMVKTLDTIRKELTQATKDLRGEMWQLAYEAVERIEDALHDLKSNINTKQAE